MRVASRGYRRTLRIEGLELRTLMSGAPLAAGDVVIPIHAQVGSTALETVLGVAAKIDSVEKAIDAYLNSVPGWHLTGGFDKTPTYAGMVDGNVVLGANGLMKSANVSLSASGDIAAAIEGYYGISVLHVGAGVAADLSASVNASAAYSLADNTWSFGGAASLAGYVKGYAAATAWPLRGEVYVQGTLSASAALNAASGVASANLAMVGSVGADAKIQSLFGGWTTVASTSRNLASWQYGTTINVGTWLQAEINGLLTLNRAANQMTTTGAIGGSAKSSAPVTTPAVSTANLTAAIVTAATPAPVTAPGTALSAAVQTNVYNVTTSKPAQSVEAPAALGSAVETPLRAAV
jgi:hypothetical protein